MRRQWNRLFTVLFACLVMTAVSCKDSPTIIATDAFLEGTVRDAVGDPVEGVVVSLEYTLDGYDVYRSMDTKKLPMIQDLDPDGDLIQRYSILDLEPTYLLRQL